MKFFQSHQIVRDCNTIILALLFALPRFFFFMDIRRKNISRSTAEIVNIFELCCCKNIEVKRFIAVNAKKLSVLCK
jgi:hypothetical protein